MAKLVMCRGIPASGKSTWTKKMVRHGHGYVIEVNRDGIRLELGLPDGGWSKEKEYYVTTLRDERIKEGLRQGLIVISSDTNLKTYHRMHMQALARQFKAEFEVKVFDTPLETCLERNRLRVGNARVPESKIKEMYRQMERI